MSRPILMGVDGSATCTAALLWASREAALRHAPLHLVHAFPWPLFGSTSDPQRTATWVHTRQALHEAEQLARRTAPGIEVTSELVVDDPAAALIERAPDHDLLVVGTRGDGGFTGLIVGSVAFKVAGHAPCQTVLVPATPPAEHEPHQIIAGVDGDTAEPVLRAAFEEAALRGVLLNVVHAYRLAPLPPGSRTIPLGKYSLQVERAQEHRLAELLSGWREKFPEVRTTISLVNESARRALINASARAELVVVGAKDHQRFSAVPLGGVAYSVIHHAACPVLLAR